MNWDELAGQGWEREDKINERTHANQAILDQIQGFLEAQAQPMEQPTLGEGETFPVNPHAERERGVGLSALRALAGSPDVHALPTTMLGQKATELMRMASPENSLTKSWEILNRQRERQDALKTLSAQKAADAQSLEATRQSNREDLKNKFNQIDAALAKGQINQGEAKEMKNQLLGVQTKPRGELEQALEIMKLPKPIQEQIFNIMRQKAQSTHITVAPSAKRDLIQGEDDQGQFVWDAATQKKTYIGGRKMVRQKDPEDPATSQRYADILNRPENPGIMGTIGKTISKWIMGDPGAVPGGAAGEATAPAVVKSYNPDAPPAAQPQVGPERFAGKRPGRYKLGGKVYNWDGQRVY